MKDKIKFGWLIEADGLFNDVSFELNLTLALNNKYPKLSKKIEKALSNIINSYKKQILEGKWRIRLIKNDFCEEFRSSEGLNKIS